VKNEDPWKEIPPSPSASSLIGHLILESRPHELFRARDPLGRRILFLVHERASETTTKLPTMAGLELESRSREADGRVMLSVRLENESNADIFARFCDDIIATVSSAETEAIAVQALVGRTWKWHALLKGARKTTLSREAQLGLIGELQTLLQVIAPTAGIGTALEAWRGSEGAPKDFELYNMCIECKARGASSRAKVRITSEHQLADVPGQRIFLIVSTYSTGTKNGHGVMNLHQVVELLRSTISKQLPSSTEMLEEKLESAGYEDEHEYDLFAGHLDSQAFGIEDGFPRIVPSTYPNGPSEVSYDLPLSSISRFEVAISEVQELIKIGARHDD
jgi:hypothetical protein